MSAFFSNLLINSGFSKSRNCSRFKPVLLFWLRGDTSQEVKIHSHAPQELRNKLLVALLVSNNITEFHGQRISEFFNRFFSKAEIRLSGSA